MVEDSSLPFERRAAEWDATGLPVPADVREWDAPKRRRARLYETLEQEAVWVFTRTRRKR